MVAISNKLIFAILFLVVSVSGYADSNLSSTSEAAHNMSFQEFEMAKNRLESAIERCDKKRKAVPASSITPLGLELDQIKAALFALNSYAEERCEDGAREAFFVAASIHREVSRRYGISAGEALEYTEDLMFSHYWRTLEIEAEYLRIEEKKRIMLENLEELKIPFLILETVELIENEK